MNTVEDRLRAALDAKAETFSASPDAWQRIGTKSHRGADRRIRRGVRQLTRRSPFLLPTAAAAVVVAVVLGATAVGHGFAGSAARGKATIPRSTTAHQPPPPALAGAINGMLASDPAVSAIITLNLRPGVMTWAWIGAPSPAYWFPYIATSREFCHFVTSGNGEGSGDCWPMPSLSPAKPATVISNNDTVGIGSPVLSGVAEPDVTSVTAVFPDGQRFPGVMGTGRGFPVKAWSVLCPKVSGTKLVFTGPAGKVLATLSTAAPVGPVVLDLPQPAHGGVTMFSYPASRDGTPGGRVTAYLVDGHVAFFAPQLFGGMVSPADATAAPAIAGTAQPFTTARKPVTTVIKGKRVTLYEQSYTLVKAFGYAHADVAKVVIGLPSGEQVTTTTFAGGWPGSGLRLWQVSLPPASWSLQRPSPTLTATAYNAAGQVVGRVKLAVPQI